MALHPDEAQTLLGKRLTELERQEALAREGVAPVTLDHDSVGRLSRVIALQQQATALASQRRRKAERNRIQAALRRIGIMISAIASRAETRLPKRGYGIILPRRAA